MAAVQWFSFDRIEGGQAVLVDDDGHSFTVPVGALPAKAAEGDMLRKEAGAYVVDAAKTSASRQEIAALENQLFGDQ